MPQRFAQILLTTLLLVGAPLAGVWWTGGDLQPYLQFPPLTRQTPQPGFDARVFALMLLVNLALLTALVQGLRHCARWQPDGGRRSGSHGWPAWGWLGIAWLIFWWMAAWTRWSWLAPLQKHTFTPLWMGYIVVVNALTRQRAGTCLLTRRPRTMAGLAILSALFWWFFEYLNRFVQNWHYLEVGDFSRTQYILFATLAFATVLPAVISTLAWMTSLAPFRQPVRIPLGPNLQGQRSWRPQAMMGLIGAVLILGLLPRWPQVLFPFVWVAPVFVLIGIEALWKTPPAIGHVLQVDRRPLFLAPLAALVCGFFWELWNLYSLAKWQYTIPYVQGWHLFEMPLPGYGGYLPFGWECWAVAFWVYPDLLEHRSGALRLTDRGQSH